VGLDEFMARNEKFKTHNPDGFEKALLKFKHKQMLELNKKIRPDDIKEICGLDANSILGKEYILDQHFALNFAVENRKIMIARKKAVERLLETLLPFLVTKKKQAQILLIDEIFPGVFRMIFSCLISIELYIVVIFI
jgi:hypothetical protein